MLYLRHRNAKNVNWLIKKFTYRHCHGNTIAIILWNYWNWRLARCRNTYMEFYLSLRGEQRLHLSFLSSISIRHETALTIQNSSSQRWSQVSGNFNSILHGLKSSTVFNCYVKNTPTADMYCYRSDQKVIMFN
jgi:hypothetical protein